MLSQWQSKKARFIVCGADIAIATSSIIMPLCKTSTPVGSSVLK